MIKERKEIIERLIVETNERLNRAFINIGVKDLKEFNLNKSKLEKENTYHRYNDIVDDVSHLKQLYNVLTYIDLEEEIVSYSELKENWDGYGGKVPNIEYLKEISSFIMLLIKNKIHPPKSMIAGSSEVSLYWDYRNNYVELSFDEQGYSYFINEGGKYYGKDDNNVESIEIKLLNKLLEFKNV